MMKYYKINIDTKENMKNVITSPRMLKIRYLMYSAGREKYCLDFSV